METIKQAIEHLLAKDTYTFEDLRTIMVILRSEDGCPWDREQTHRSIRQNFIEETYEVVEAIDTEDPKLLREELGDVLLQVIFHARMEEEAKREEEEGEKQPQNQAGASKLDLSAKLKRDDKDNHKDGE